MKEINVKRITDAVKEMAGEIACVYQPDIYEAIQKGEMNEQNTRAKIALGMLKENADIAREKHIPICQDTGLAIIYLTIGQDVHFVGGDIKEAVHEGVRRGYTENYLRASSVTDPLFDRKNTKDNTPAVIYMDIVPGDEVVVEMMAKGFGSENKSALRMLTPAEGIDGVKQFVKETVEHAGANACPPFVIGVGIGGTFDSCAVLSKQALLRPISESNPDERYAKLEQELLDSLNDLHIGPLGLKGETTALKVQIAYAPTHIAGLPVAVNVCCHVCRHAKKVIL